MLSHPPHPLLDLRAFTTIWSRPLSQLPTPDWLTQLADVGAETPFDAPDDAHKKAVRDMLRHGGFKPAGRNKPCSEYMRAAALSGRFPTINAAVDLTNVAVLHGALPVCTVDLDKLVAPLHVGVAPPDSAYVFNASGQEIKLTGLWCLHDAQGPCSNAIKDSQRTKVGDETTRSLTLIWGTRALPGRAEALMTWQVQLTERLGGVCDPWPVGSPHSNP